MAIIFLNTPCMKLIFATNNAHKVEEIQAILPPALSIITLKEAGINVEIPEPYDTLKENAAQKAHTIYGMTHTDCFSEDTGLEVVALNGEPGVRSARYAGEDKQFDNNIDKLLANLTPYTDRSAQFKTVICLLLNGKEYYFEGICSGRITTEPQGSGGFGYDSVFIPDGATKTFAQMTLDEKNQYSHRRKATGNLVTFLNKLLVNRST